MNPIFYCHLFFTLYLVKKKMMNSIPNGILCGVMILFPGACTKDEPEESPRGNEEVFEMD